MDIQEFYKDKEKRDLIDTITTAKWVTEEQKEAIIDILAEDWESDRAAGAKAAEDPHRLQAKRAEKKRAQDAEFKKKQAEKRKKMSQDDQDWASDRAAAAQSAG